MSFTYNAVSCMTVLLVRFYMIPVKIHFICVNICLFVSFLFNIIIKFLSRFCWLEYNFFVLTVGKRTLHVGTNTTFLCIYLFIFLSNQKEYSF